MWTICKHVIKNEVLISPGHTVRAVSHVRLMLGKCKSFRRDRAQGGRGRAPPLAARRHAPSGFAVSPSSASLIHHDIIQLKDCIYVFS